MKKISLTLVLLLFAGSFVMAQHRLKVKGDEHFSQLSYELAIPYYERYLKRFEDHDAVLRLADSYRLTHNYGKAAEWYAKVMQLPAQPPIAHFHYGHALLQEGRIDEAKTEFQAYARLAPGDPRGQNYVKALERYDDLFLDSIRVTIDHLSLNTGDAEFGIFPYQEGFIIASARDLGSPVIQDFNWLDKPFLDFYYVAYKQDSAKFAKAEKLEGEANTRYHESNFTMADGANEFYFTRNNYYDKKKGQSDAGIILLKVYKAKINGMETSAVEEFAYNSDDYSVTHPCISADGQSLYFVSDMPGGEGGKDLYVCRKSGAGWAEPQNVRQANTQGDEMFPFIHPDGTLYFSSDGHPGLGHLDIFYLKPGDKSRALNMGYPLNTPYDDFAVWLNRDNTEGYLSSDREGGTGGDDIYHFTLKKPTLELIVLDSIAELPLEGATVQLIDLTENSLVEYKTDSSGRRIWQTEFGHEFKVKIDAPEFKPREVRINTDIGQGTMFFSYTVQLYSPPPAFTGLVIDDSTQARLPGATVEFVNLREKTSEVRTADRNGRFHFKLKPNSLYEINARHKGYMTYTDRISTSLAAFEGDTVIPLRMERIPFNKPILLKNIHYDFDKWTIRYDAYNDLIFVANLMKKNPTLIVELGSHTDCRGSDSYNEKLSQKRANSARYFIIDLGIAPNRIVAKGYGETKLSNNCDDGVPCSENKHFANRRTEFKIIGELEDVDMKNSILETEEGKDPTPIYVPETRNDARTKEPETPKYQPGSSEEIDNVKAVNPSEWKPDASGNLGSPKAANVEKTEAPAAPKSDPATLIGDSDAQSLRLPDQKYDPNSRPASTLFRVKVGAFVGELAPAALDRLKGFRPYTFFIQESNGMMGYFVGEYLKYEDVAVALEQVKACGYYGAYVTAFRDGKELGFGELRQLIGQ